MRLLTVIAALTLAAPAGAETFSGEWQEFTFLGDHRWDEGRCAAAMFMERRYSLQSRADSARQLYGQYSVSVRGAIYRNGGGDCRLPGQASRSPSFWGTRIWGVEGFSTGARARLQGKYDNCIGDNCQDPQLERGDFIFALELSDDRLIDRDEKKPDQVRAIFHRGPWHQTRNREALTAYRELMSLLGGGRPEEIRPRLGLGGTEAEISEFLASLPIFRAYLGSIASREPIEVHVLAPNATVAVTPEMPEALAILSQQVNGSDGTKWLEICLLEKRASGWRLTGLYY